MPGEGHDNIRGYRLDVIPGESPLMSYSKWISLGYPTYALSATIKMRLGYGEHETFEVLETGEQYHSQDVNYIMVMGNSVINGVLQSGQLISGLYVYRVDSIERVGMKAFRTDQQYQTNQSCAVRFTCTLDVLATLYLHENNGGPHTAGFTLNARWSRLPMQAVVEPFQVRPAQMMRSRSESLPDDIIESIDGNNGTRRLCWVSITTTANAFIRYGTFACFDISGYQNVSYSNGVWDVYPSISQIMRDPTMITTASISASNVLSISVSARCPYEYKMKTVTIGGANYTYPVLMHDENTETGTNPGKTDSGVRWAVYNLNNPTNPPASAEHEFEYVLDDLMEVHSGRIKIYDVNDTMVGTIDGRYAVYDSITQKYKIALKSRTYFNDLVLITEIELPDGTLMKFPEGTLSFISDAWNDYARAQLLYDRELLAMSQDRIMTDAALGLSNSLVNGAFGGLAGGVGLGTLSGVTSAGVSIVKSIQDYQQNERTQSAKENLMKSAPDTLFNGSVGFNYVLQLRRAKYGMIALDLPHSVTLTETENYLKRYGYPVSDLYMGVTMAQLQGTVQGFLQANALLEVIEGNTVKVCAGYLRNVLDRQLRQGIHFKVIT